MQVKGNQKKLLAKCMHLADVSRPVSNTTQVGKRERNRIERRTVCVFHKNTYDLGDVWNDSIQAMIRVERETRTFNTITKQFENSEEIAFYISTTRIFSAEEFGTIIRSHWGIENSNHYVRDVSLKEDFSRIRKNPENIATLRSFALNIMRANNETNISQTLYRNAVNVERVLRYAGVS